MSPAITTNGYIYDYTGAAGFPATTGRVSRSITKPWYVPKTPEMKELFEGAKNDIKNFLVSNKDGVNTTRIVNFLAESGVELPLSQLGLAFNELLFHCYDFIQVRQFLPYVSVSRAKFIFLNPRGLDAETRHIQALVQGQAADKKKWGQVRPTLRNTVLLDTSSLLDAPPPRTFSTPLPLFPSRGGRGGRRGTLTPPRFRANTIGNSQGGSLTSQRRPTIERYVIPPRLASLQVGRTPLGPVSQPTAFTSNPMAYYNSSVPRVKLQLPSAFSEMRRPSTTFASVSQPPSTSSRTVFYSNGIDQTDNCQPRRQEIVYLPSAPKMIQVTVENPGRNNGTEPIHGMDQVDNCRLKPGTVFPPTPAAPKLGNLAVNRIPAISRNPPIVVNGKENVQPQAVREKVVIPPPRPSAPVQVPKDFVHPLEACPMDLNKKFLDKMMVAESFGNHKNLLGLTVTGFKRGQPTTFYVRLKGLGDELTKMESMMKTLYSFNLANMPKVTKEEVMMNGIYGGFDKKTDTWRRIQVVKVNEGEEKPLHVFLIDHGTFLDLDCSDIRYLKKFHSDGVMRHAYLASFGYLPGDPRMKTVAAHYFMCIAVGEAMTTFLMNVETREDGPRLLLRFGLIHSVAEKCGDKLHERGIVY